MSWGNTYKSKLAKLVTKQNKCISSLLTVEKMLENADPYYNLLGILKLDNIFKLKMSTFAYKIKNIESSIPAVYIDSLTPASEINHYNTRFAAKQNFYSPKVKTNYGIFTFKFTVSKIWESIPTKLKNLAFLPFKKQYKQHILDTQK